ncbi:MAG TPA: hypothetical protein PK536_13010 [Ignavibacteria bacterium]|nr:hypothetical protein [Bacteroidota bacterium]HRI86358.1 hypothetical protein [Ignavibacteria bacterium]HRK00758.1 hypothetical protein [Ignavibacteria bacterium]
MITAAKWIIILFGIFLICCGILMLINPEKARSILKKAGSTNFINYAEITIRMIPAVSMIIYSEFTEYEIMYKIFGWFMLSTSVVLYIIPRNRHHSFSLKSAEILKPEYFRIISPVSILFGMAVIYGVV